MRGRSKAACTTGVSICIRCAKLALRPACMTARMPWSSASTGAKETGAKETGAKERSPARAPAAAIAAAGAASARESSRRRLVTFSPPDPVRPPHTHPQDGALPQLGLGTEPPAHPTSSRGVVPFGRVRPVAELPRSGQDMAYGPGQGTTPPEVGSPGTTGWNMAPVPHYRSPYSGSASHAIRGRKHPHNAKSTARAARAIGPKQALAVARGLPLRRTAAGRPRRPGRPGSPLRIGVYCTSWSGDLHRSGSRSTRLLPPSKVARRSNTHCPPGGRAMLRSPPGGIGPVAQAVGRPFVRALRAGGDDVIGARAAVEQAEGFRRGRPGSPRRRRCPRLGRRSRRGGPRCGRRRTRRADRRCSCRRPAGGWPPWRPAPGPCRPAGRGPSWSGRPGWRRTP